LYLAWYAERFRPLPRSRAKMGVKIGARTAFSVTLHV